MPELNKLMLCQDTMRTVDRLIYRAVKIFSFEEFSPGEYYAFCTFVLVVFLLLLFLFFISPGTNEIPVFSLKLIFCCQKICTYVPFLAAERILTTNQLMYIR